MASPLLEDGAIDGARGILINISGSSSLKLSEVNEASTLIQNAAHEEANIIFGAVLDENMADEVKITVIATGFRKEMPERRERMLNAALQPAIPRVEITTQPVRPRFASEEFEEPVLVTTPRRAFVEVPVEPEPQPVYSQPAFEEPATREPAAAAPDHFEADAHDEIAVAVAEPPAHPETVVTEDHSQNGENLDIPAFLRRGGF